jgi:hypothetical protein
MTREHTLKATPKHINRFGKYTLNLARTSAAPDYTLSPRPASRPVLASALL